MLDKTTIKIILSNINMLIHNCDISTKGLQKLILYAKTAGIKFSVFESCAEKLDVKDKIEELNLELKLWGKPLTEIIKNNKNY